jgi:hypothetical protein
MRLPYAEERERYSDIVKQAVIIKSDLVAMDPTERRFLGPKGKTEVAFRAHLCSEIDRAEAVAAKLHSVEGENEKVTFSLFNVAEEDLQSVLEETGTPAAWNPVVDLTSEADAKGPIDRGQSFENLETLKANLRRMYSSAKQELREVGADDSAETEESSEDVSGELDDAGATKPVPSETLIEELSNRLHIHPRSTFRLLREMKKEEGLTCPSEMSRLAQDHVSVIVLRLLGHRWPREVEGALNWSGLAEAEGIIPITDTLPSRYPLVRRLNEVLSHVFGANSIVEFEDLVTWIMRRHCDVIEVAGRASIWSP